MAWNLDAMIEAGKRRLPQEIREFEAQNALTPDGLVRPAFKWDGGVIGFCFTPDQAIAFANQMIQLALLGKSPTPEIKIP